MANEISGRPLAVVTGASSGIGFNLAKCCAEGGYDLLLAADQAIKFWARHALTERGSLTVIPNVFDLTLTYNKGVAFGLFQGAGVLLAPVAVAIAIGAID